MSWRGTNNKTFPFLTYRTQPHEITTRAVIGPVRHASQSTSTSSFASPPHITISIVSPSTSHDMSSTGAGPSPTQWPNLSDAIVRGFGLSSSSGRWDFSNPPFGFGPLNALHATALMGHPLSLSLRVVLLYAVVPLFPLYLQAFLLLGEQSRRIRALRMALGGAAVAGIVKAWLSFRFTGGSGRLDRVGEGERGWSWEGVGLSAGVRWARGRKEGGESRDRRG